MKKKIVNLLHKIGVYDRCRKTYYDGLGNAWRLFGSLTNRNERVIQSYAKDHGIKKMHLGCGTNYLQGWINTDYRPGPKSVFLDVTKSFDFSDNTFDYAFTEHVIEHVPYMAGQNMLAETFRVLKSGGILRLVTPDINFLINLYKEPELEIHKQYIDWNSRLFIKDRAPHTALSVLNNYVRDWGHVYIYDVPTLRAEMERCGFINITTQKLNQSEHKALVNIEHDTRHPEGYLALESLVIEATKP